jgi:hypothetical protein
MYLVRLPDAHPIQWLFVDKDPRLCGCAFPITDGVEFRSEWIGVATCLGRSASKRLVLARSKRDPTKYKGFIRNGSVIEPHYERLEGVPLSLTSWTVYAAACRAPAPEPFSLANESDTLSGNDWTYFPNPSAD